MLPVTLIIAITKTPKSLSFQALPPKEMLFLLLSLQGEGWENNWEGQRFYKQPEGTQARLMTVDLAVSPNVLRDQ